VRGGRRRQVSVPALPAAEIDGPAGWIPGRKSLGLVDIEAADRVDHEGAGRFGGGFFGAPEEGACRTPDQDKKKGDDEEADQHMSPARDKD